MRPLPRRDEEKGGDNEVEGEEDGPREERKPLDPCAAKQIRTSTRGRERTKKEERWPLNDGRHFGDWNIYFFLVHFVRKSDLQNYNVNHPFYFVRFAKNFEFLERVLKDFRVKSRKFN